MIILHRNKKFYLVVDSNVLCGKAITGQKYKFLWRDKYLEGKLFMQTDDDDIISKFKSLNEGKIADEENNLEESSTTTTSFASTSGETQLTESQSRLDENEDDDDIPLNLLTQKAQSSQKRQELPTIRVTTDKSTPQVPIREPLRAIQNRPQQGRNAPAENPVSTNIVNNPTAPAAGNDQALAPIAAINVIAHAAANDILEPPADAAALNNVDYDSASSASDDEEFTPRLEEQTYSEHYKALGTTVPFRDGLFIIKKKLDYAREFSKSSETYAENLIKGLVRKTIRGKCTLSGLSYKTDNNNRHVYSKVPKLHPLIFNAILNEVQEYALKENIKWEDEKILTDEKCKARFRRSVRHGISNLLAAKRRNVRNQPNNGNNEENQDNNNN